MANFFQDNIAYDLAQSRIDMPEIIQTNKHSHQAGGVALAEPYFRSQTRLEPSPVQAIR